MNDPRSQAPQKSPSERKATSVGARRGVRESVDRKIYELGTNRSRFRDGG
jgi:hypothetical protein